MGQIKYDPLFDFYREISKKVGAQIGPHTPISTIKRLKVSYFQLYRPDIGGDKNVAGKVNDAFDVLVDPNTKQIYDSLRIQHQNPRKSESIDGFVVQKGRFFLEPQLLSWYRKERPEDAYVFSIIDTNKSMERSIGFVLDVYDDFGEKATTFHKATYDPVLRNTKLNSGPIDVVGLNSQQVRTILGLHVFFESLRTQ